MKRFVFLMLFVCSIVFVYAEKTELVVVCEDKEDFPSVMGNGNDFNWAKPGATVEALKILEKKLGITLKFKRLPWKRALEEELKNGTADMIFTASYKKEREVFGVFPMKNGAVDESFSLYVTSYVFYKMKTSTIEWDGSTLKNFTGSIGAPRGYSIVDDLKKKGYTVEEGNDTLNDFQKLSMGRVGLVAALELTGDVVLQKNPTLKDIVKITPPIVKKPYYIMLSHQFVQNNPILTAKIWATIKEIRDTEYKKLASKYVN